MSDDLYGESDPYTGEQRQNVFAELGYAPVPVAEQDKLSRVEAIFNGLSGLLIDATDVYQRVRYNARPAMTTGGNEDTRFGEVSPREGDQAAAFGFQGLYDSTIRPIQPYLPLLLIGVAGVLIFRAARS